MKKKKRFYRDSHGRFVSRQRAKAESFIDEMLPSPPEQTADDPYVDSVDELFSYDDYDFDDWDIYEFHGTGDTGKRK